MLRIAILLLALGAGGAAAWVATSVTPVPRQSAVALPPPQPTAEVLVAAGPLVPGAVLKPEDMRWQSWPENALVEGFVVRTSQPDAPEAFTGQLTRVDFAPGEPIRAEKLILGKGGFLSVMLDPGKRAVAVRISAESTAGGFIMPDDRVDVLRTVSLPGESGQSRMVSETILRNVRVLAIDQNTDNRTSGAVLGKTATLELETDEVEIVVAGEASGLLSLSLRSFADNDVVPPIVAAPAAKPAAKPTVRIFRSGSVEQVELN